MDVLAAEEIARQIIARSTGLNAEDGDAWPQGRDAPGFYGQPEEFPRGSWLVHVESEILKVGAARIIVIRKADG